MNVSLEVSRSDSNSRLVFQYREVGKIFIHIFIFKRDLAIKTVSLLTTVWMSECRVAKPSNDLLEIIRRAHVLTKSDPKRPTRQTSRASATFIILVLRSSQKFFFHSSIWNIRRSSIHFTVKKLRKNFFLELTLSL